MVARHSLCRFHGHVIVREPKRAATLAYIKSASWPQALSSLASTHILYVARFVPPALPVAELRVLGTTLEH